jgi:hypothetical protein
MGKLLRLERAAAPAVQVPGGTHGTFTLFSQAGGAALAADPTAYTMGVQFKVSTVGVNSATLTAVWFNSPAGAASLPGMIALYLVAGTVLIMSQAAAWSGVAGAGWVRAPVTSPPALTLGASYKACILMAVGANFYGSTANYWTSGAGGAGITNGPLSAPNNAGGDGGQDTFNQSAVLTYPLTSFNATNYWVDPEVAT